MTWNGKWFMEPWFLYVFFLSGKWSDPRWDLWEDGAPCAVPWSKHQRPSASHPGDPRGEVGPRSKNQVQELASPISFFWSLSLLPWNYWISWISIKLINPQDKVIFGKGIFYFGGNRGRGQARKASHIEIRETKGCPGGSDVFFLMFGWSTSLDNRGNLWKRGKLYPGSRFQAQTCYSSTT